MNWEERKREKKPPAPDFKSNTHEAAPFYTEDLTYQETDPTSDGQRREDLKKLELKEKFAYLESQLHYFKIKLSSIEKEHEKLLEKQTETNSSKRISVLEQEVESLRLSLDLKNKQCEGLEKALKAERARYSQELTELKGLARSLKDDLGVRQVVVSESEELLELRQENQRLKEKIFQNDLEKRKIAEKNERELLEQQRYFEELLENNKKDEILNIEYQEDSLEKEDNQPAQDPVLSFKDSFENLPDPETVSPGPEARPGFTENIPDLFDTPQSLFEPDQGFNIFDKPQSLFEPDQGFNIFEKPSDEDNQISQFFSKDEQPNLEQLTENRELEEEPEEPNDFFNKIEYQNAADFFDAPQTSSYQTIPSSLFDF